MPFHSISFGSKEIRFKLQFSDRRTLGISVFPDTSVVVTAPSRFAEDLASVKAKILKRAPWILRQQTKFSNYPPKPPARRFVSGESYRYLGRQFRLKVVEGGSKSVRLKDGYLEVTVPDKQDRTTIESEISDWYRQRARQFFAKKLEELRDRFANHGIDSPSFRLRKMTMRWGSCGRNGIIYLNPELVRSPSSCIEYVIVHELCHIIHPNHDKKFYKLLNRTMPDWEKRKSRLERMGGL